MSSIRPTCKLTEENNKIQANGSAFITSVLHLHIQEKQGTHPPMHKAHLSLRITNKL